MKIYRYVPDVDEYDCLDNVGDWSAFDQGVRLAPHWRPTRVAVDARAGRSGDFPSLLGAIPVLSARAWKALQGLIGERVEALPLDCAAGPYFAINVLDHIDALDYPRSEVERFDDGGVMAIDSYAFKPKVLQGRHIFKLPETAPAETLVSGELKALVEKHKLKGLRFDELGEAR